MIEDDLIPTIAQRRIGEVYLRRHGDMVKDDPAFVAAAVYRMMLLAKHKPDDISLLGYWRDAANVR